MIEGFFIILNFQEIWGSTILKVNSLFDPENFQFLDALELYWAKVLDNPLASIITILVLIGLPYTLFKAKESNTQANERLDRLMEEMRDFEFEKPLIDLQDKFKNISIDNSTITSYDEDVAQLNLANVVPDLSIEEDPIPHLEPPSFTKQLTLDQEMTDDFLAKEPMDLQMETEDETTELSPLAKGIFDEAKVVQPEPRVENEEFIDQYFKDLHKRDEDRDLVFATNGNLDETEIIPPVESSDEDEEYASHDIDDLQTRMEQAIKNLRLKYPSREETEEIASGETNTDSAPSALAAVKQTSQKDTKEDENNDPSPPSSEQAPHEEDASSPSPESTASDSPAGIKENSLKKSDLITHLKSFQKNLEIRFDSQNKEAKQNSNESQQGQISSFNRILKITGIISPAPNKTTDDENKESLESFIFLKDQKRPE